KWLLMKAVFLYCQLNKINTIIMSSRPVLARDYVVLGFEDIGTTGIYNHPLLGDKTHHTYKLSISDTLDRIYSHNPQLGEYFIGQDVRISMEGMLLNLPSSSIK
ncbi:MAG: hypothetical protein SVY53_04150, partial [Chloroflexota bacterium]|nr:hypothetical protein [Chloroflexota bacterium]